MKTFQVPIIYRSPLITAIKNRRKQEDRLKKDFTPTLLDLGRLKIYLARHFGFCYGVENAIEIAFRSVEENPGKRIFLLSEMIHNPQVNEDLREHGVQFLQDTLGNPLIPLDSLKPGDVVLIPAFGTTLDTMEKLQSGGIDIKLYNTTCPFVEKVWNRGEQLAQKGYSIIIHGKPRHEETRATFSHAAAGAPAIIINDMEEAIVLADFITRKRSPREFEQTFRGRYSTGFDPGKDLERIGVINQTTQLASDTQAIADFLKNTLIKHYGLTQENLGDRFADTRDTLCYATLDNQSAVLGMLQTKADMAFVVGGYNSSNTTHLVELCEQLLPTYFINSSENIISGKFIRHFDIHQKLEKETSGFLPDADPLRVLVTSGASCPDALVEGVIRKLAGLLNVEEKLDQ